MRALIAAELSRLREIYVEVEHAEAGGEDWFQILSYPLPKGWLFDELPQATVPIVFAVKADYPGSSPYGFLTPTGLRFEGTSPDNTGAPPGPVPFAGDWMFFSWHCEDWPNHDDAGAGPDLVRWSKSFTIRLNQGA